MNRITLLLTPCLVLLASTVSAQFGPGRHKAALPIPFTGNEPAESQIMPASSGPILLLNEPVVAESIGREIFELARDLENDPKRIYDYVHNYIKYVHYFGSKKGALLTLLEGSGNDYDQCALLVALLRAAGQNSGANYTATYKFGVMKIPYESPNNMDLKHWLGLSMPWSPATDFDVILMVNSANYARGYPKYATYPDGSALCALVAADNDLNFIFHRVVVKFTDGANAYLLDPAFKVATPIPGINVLAAMGWNLDQLMSKAEIGATVNEDYVQNLNWNELTGRLNIYVANLITDLNGNHRNLSVEQVLGGHAIQESQTEVFPPPTFRILRFPIYGPVW